MAHPALHKTTRVALWIVGSVIVLPVALIALVFAALAVPPLRAFAVKKGVAFANESMGGYTIAVKSVDRIDPFGINIRGVRLFDDKKRELVHVPWAMVRLSPRSLIHNTLRLTRVEIDGVRAHLYPPDPDAPPKPKEPPSEPSTFTYRIDHARIRDARAETEWDDRTIEAVIGTLAAGGQYGPKTALALKTAIVRVSADEQTLLSLRTTEGNWGAAQGGEIGIEAMLAGAPLTLHAQLPGLDDLEPWPLKSAELSLTQVTRRSLALLGVKDGAQLKVPVDLTVHARNVDDRLEVTARVRAGRTHKTAAIDLFATADARAYELTVGIAPMQLASVAGILPVLKVQGNLQARATPTDQIPAKLDLHWKHVAIDDGAIPAGSLRAELPLPVVRLKSLTLAGFEHALSVQGEYDTEHSRGNAALAFHELHLETIEYLKKQGVAGLLDGALSAALASTTLRADGNLKVRDFKHPSARLSSLDLGLAVSGQIASPEGHVRLKMRELAAGKYKIDQLDLDALATPRTLSGKLDVRGPDTDLKCEIGGQRGADGSLRVQGIGRGRVAKKQLSFDLRELHYGPNGLTLEELALLSGKQQLSVSGSLDAHDRVDASIALAKIDLGTWSTLGGMTGLNGLIDGKIELEGSTSKPIVDGKLVLQKVTYKSDLPIDGTFEMRGDLGERKLDAKLGLYSTTELGARIDVSVAIPQRPLELGKAVQFARVSANASVYMPVGQISAIAGDQLAGLDGLLNAKVRAEGTLDDPILEADIVTALKLPEQEGAPVEGLQLTAHVDKDEAKVSLWAKDEQGELVALNGSVEWPGGNPRKALARPEGFRTTRFQTHAELNPRRLDMMQGVFAYFTKLYAVSVPIRVGGKLDFSGENGKIEGGATMQLMVFGDKIDGRCKLGARSSLGLEAKLKQDQVEVDVSANTDGGGVIQGKVSTVFALHALSGDAPVIGPAKLTLEGKSLALYKLPGLCNLVGGVGSFKIGAEGLGKTRPSVDMTASIVGLQAPNSESLDAELKARAGGPDAALEAKLKSKGRNVGYIQASVPLSYPDKITPTVLPDAPLKARVQLDQLMLANVLSFTETLGRVGGKANADLTVTGKLSDPFAVGHVTLENANFSIASLAQPFRDINGRIDIKGRSVKITKLTAHDRGGKLSANGFATLRQDMTGDGGLFVQATKFPLRQQGTIVGELTTRARADFKIPADLKAQAQLTILDGTIWITGERGRSVQSLDPHPDIRFADEQIAHESTPTEEKAEDGGGITLSSFKIKTDQPLWLNHKEFSLQVGVDIDMTTGEAGPKLTGEAKLVRGELKLFGKAFKLKDGRVGFTGDMPPDPELDIKAVYKPPTGPELHVAVTGRGSAPVLEFSGAATTAGEAVAVLTGASATQQQQGNAAGDASSQMAAMAADLTAGLLVMTARREFGDWVPMLSVETGEKGNLTGASAAFDASKLIPPWAQGFARSAYVEGIVNSQNSGGNAARSLGVRVEVALPRDFATSVGYGPGPGWQTDVTWSP